MRFTTDDVCVLYVHGAGNKPPADDLKRAWDDDLFQKDMGGRTRMVHYADLPHRRPGTITADACGADGALAALASDALTTGTAPDGPPRDGSAREAEATEAAEAFGAMTAEQQAFALSLTIGMAARAAAPPRTHRAGRRRARGGGRRGRHRTAAAARSAAPVRLWMDFADRSDPVTLDTTLADDFRAPARMITDVPVDNRSPNDHASCGYLRAGRVRGEGGGVRRSALTGPVRDPSGRNARGSRRPSPSRSRRCG